MATTIQPADGCCQLTTHDKRRVLSSAELMGGGSELIIKHAGCEYRLRITKQQKLILTK